MWTQYRVDTLIRMWDKGATSTEIGEMLGVTRNAVTGKVKRLGLKPRLSPIMPRTEKLDLFADHLAETGDVVKASHAMGIKPPQGAVMLTEIRKGLGWQAV